MRCPLRTMQECDPECAWLIERSYIDISDHCYMPRHEMVCAIANIAASVDAMPVNSKEVK